MIKPEIKECGNCGKKEFQRAEGTYILTKIEKREEGFNFKLGSGIPIVVFVCANCGELKLFPAKLFDEF